MQRSTQRRPRVASFYFCCGCAASHRAVAARPPVGVDITTPSPECGCWGRPTWLRSSRSAAPGELLQWRSGSTDSAAPRNRCAQFIDSMTHSRSRRSLVSIAIAAAAAFAPLGMRRRRGTSVAPPAATYTVGGAVSGSDWKWPRPAGQRRRDLTVAATTALFAFAHLLPRGATVRRHGQEPARRCPGRRARSPTARARSWRRTCRASPSPASALLRDFAYVTNENQCNRGRFSRRRGQSARWRRSPSGP